MRLIFPILMIMGAVGMLISYHAMTSVNILPIFDTLGLAPETRESKEVPLTPSGEGPTFNFHAAAAKVHIYFASACLFIGAFFGLRVSCAFAPRVSIRNAFSIIGALLVLVGAAAHYMGMRGMIMTFHAMKTQPDTADPNLLIESIHGGFQPQFIGVICLLLGALSFTIAGRRTGKIAEPSKPAKVSCYFSVVPVLMAFGLMFWSFFFTKALSTINFQEVDPSELAITLSSYQMGCISTFGLLFVGALISLISYAQKSRPPEQPEAESSLS